MNIFSIMTNLRLQDILDILFLTVVAYYFYIWFWGTKAFKALVGLLALGIIYTISRFFGLFLTTWVFQIFWQVLVILLIILFQSEIRQVLERVNPLQMIGLHSFPRKADWISDLVEAAFFLAKRKIGALIIIERTDRVEELITGGVPLDTEPISEVLTSFFQKNSPLHDGALVIQKGRVARVACYLPLSSAEKLPKEWGTRHRAALGLSERCDAWVVVVSEERGEVSLAREGQMFSVEDPEKLTKFVLEAIKPLKPPKTTLWTRVYSLVMNRWILKVGTLGLVCVIWMLLAWQQNFEVILRVPLETKNLSAKMEILRPVKPWIRIIVQGLRRDASTLDESNVHARINLSRASAGKKSYSITRNQIVLPNDRVRVVRIEPSKVEFELREKP